MCVCVGGWQGEDKELGELEERLKDTDKQRGAQKDEVGRSTFASDAIFKTLQSFRQDLLILEEQYYVELPSRATIGKKENWNGNTGWAIGRSEK